MGQALVIVRDGPATERGWLAIRTAMALGLAGHQVTVLLYAQSAGWALPLDARSWLGGDPGADLEGLVGELDAEVLVDAESLAQLGPAAAAGVRPGVRTVDAAGLEQRYAAADLVVAM